MDILGPVQIYWHDAAASLLEKHKFPWQQGLQKYQITVVKQALGVLIYHPDLEVCLKDKSEGEVI